MTETETTGEFRERSDEIGDSRGVKPPAETEAICVEDESERRRGLKRLY